MSRIRIVVSPDLLTLGEMRLASTVQPILKSGTAPEFSSLVELLRGNLEGCYCRLTKRGSSGSSCAIQMSYFVLSKHAARAVCSRIVNR